MPCIYTHSTVHTLLCIEIATSAPLKIEHNSSLSPASIRGSLPAAACLQEAGAVVFRHLQAVQTDELHLQLATAKLPK